MTGDTVQRPLDLFRELNQYNERYEDYPSDTVFKPPRRTSANGWAKFHAARECGSQNVAYVEDTTTTSLGERYEYDLYCYSCGYRIPEDEVLFIGGDWYDERGFEAYEQLVGDIWLPEERVVELGPNPSEDELLRALKLTRIEQRGDSLLAFSFKSSDDGWQECRTCENKAPLTFNGECRMCYDGEWTSRMQDSVRTLARQVRERNNSFKHRLPKHVDPLTGGDRAFEGTVLWRRSTHNDTYPKLVYIDQVFKDVSDDHYEYIIRDLEQQSMWVVENDELVSEFYDTELDYRREENPLDNERVKRVFERVCE